MREICFTATQSEPTKVLLTTSDDSLFKAEWENEDCIAIDLGNGAPVTASYKGNNKFSASSSQTGVKNVRAIYPVSTDSFSARYINFGNTRVQNGNNYNANYDIMASEYQNVDFSSINDISFHLQRKTAISYFHFTSSLDPSEKINSALLQIVNTEASYVKENSYISAERGIIDLDNIFKLDQFAGNPDSGILTTFENNTNPSVSDFKLWFNTFPVSDVSFSLLVDTPKHILRMTNKSINHMAGIIYVTSTNVPESSWKEKINAADYNWEQVSDISNLNSGDYIILSNYNKTNYMSKDTTTSNRKSHNVIDANVQVLLVGKGVLENTYSLYTINDKQNVSEKDSETIGYLYIPNNNGTTSNLLTNLFFSQQSSWTISINDNGYADIISNCSGTDAKYLMYSNSAFKGYNKSNASNKGINNIIILKRGSKKQ